MRWHDLIFSNRSPHRPLRHVIFWLLWWCFFYGSFYAFQQLQDKYITWITWNPVMVIKSWLIVLTHIYACYSILYIVLPKFLESRRLVATAGLFAVIAITGTLGYLIYTELF